MNLYTHADFHRRILHDINTERGQPERSYTPKDPTSSLVYADWLEEQGMPKAAAFIRRAAPADRATSIMHYPSTIPPASPTGFAVGVYQGLGAFRPQVGRRRPQPTLNVTMYAPHPEGKGALAFNIDVPVDEGNQVAEELLAEGHAPHNDGAKRRLKLARVKIDPPSELERHAVAAMQNRKDPMALHVFADHVEENHPNSVWLPVIREMQAGGDWRAKAKETKKVHDAEKRLVPRSTRATGSASVGGVYFHPELNEWRVGSGENIVAPSHWWDENEAVNPSGIVDGKKTTMDRALHLLRNMPGGADNVIGMALAAHFFAENREERVENAQRLKLARIPIIPSGKRAGDEPGINMWTGESTRKKPPIRAVVVPESHWADGVVHGHDKAEAAHHERSAVHSAMERLAGAPVSQKDVQDHVATIRFMLNSEQGRRLLGKAGEAYTSAASALPDLLPKAYSTLLRGTAVPSRAAGPRVEHLTNLATPLVSAANRLLVLGGRASPLAERSARPESTAPAYEAVPEHEAEIPESYPDPKKRQKPPIRVPGSDADAVKTLVGESLKSDSGKATGELPPIALAENPPPLGGKLPGHSRYATIEQHAAKGRAAVIRALMDSHLISRRQAADTIRRWGRARQIKLARRTIDTKKPAGYWSFLNQLADKLARPKDNELISPRHLGGEAFASSINVDRGPEKWDRQTVDERLAGTSLAYHLRRIAQEQKKLGNHEVSSVAEHALAGVPYKHKDAFSILGRSLRSMGHKDAGLFQWDKVHEQLATDHWLEQQLKKMVARKEGENDSTYFDRIHRRVRGGPKQDDTWAFWNRLLKARQTEHGFPHNRKMSMQDWLNAIHRVSDKALDRDYMAAIQAEKNRRSTAEWRETLAKPEAHAKFARLGEAVKSTTHTGETRYTHSFSDDAGQPLGSLSLVPRGSALHVDWVGLHGAASGEQAGAAGVKHVRSLLPQIAKAYPQHDVLVGRRAGGAHRGELRGVELAPHRLARTGMIDSTNHRKRVELVKKVLSEAGFGRAVVKAALAHYGREQQPGVLAAIERATNPQHALYTAAWIGMLTQQPRVSVFHPGDGQDALHVITSPHPTEHVSEYLRRAGVPRFSSERTATGTRVFVLDPAGELNPAAWSAGLDGQHVTLRGRAHTLEGRGAYQKTIRDAEEASDASDPGAE